MTSDEKKLREATKLEEAKRLLAANKLAADNLLKLLQSRVEVASVSTVKTIKE